MFKWFQNWHKRRAAYKAAAELDRMDERQLKDIGITRVDVEKIRNGTFQGRGT